MQAELSGQMVREKLTFLKRELPKHVTAVSTPYSLPPGHAKEVRENNYSRAALQEISDHIGYYLGLLRSVEITFSEESAAVWVGTSNGTIVHSESKTPISGLYQVIDPGHSRIVLIKKPGYRFRHILAILAHECTHNYLYHYGISGSDEMKNEILTDIAAAYLGLGHLLIPGYETITFWSEGLRYTADIGYVTRKTIRTSVVLSAELRKWEPKDVIDKFPRFADRIVVRVQLGSYRNKLRKIEKAKREVDEINELYDQVRELIKSVPSAVDISSIAPEDGYVLVEIASKISVGEIAFEIKDILKRTSALEDLSFENKDISGLLRDISVLRAVVSKWRKLLGKYNR